jgi:ACT domain-containing protein
MKEGKKGRHIVLGIHISDRVHHVPGVQNLLTEYGCSIKTRIGLHAVDEKFCSPNGLIVLEMAGPEQPTFELIEKLEAIEGVDVQKMIFEHE